MQFISLNKKPWNLLIKKGKTNYLAKAYYTSKEELEKQYALAKRTRIYSSKSALTGINKIKIVFYKAKDNSFVKSTVSIYVYKEVTNEELLEFGCSF